MGLRSSSTGYLSSAEIDCQTVRWHTAVASVRTGKSAEGFTVQEKKVHADNNESVSTTFFRTPCPNTKYHDACIWSKQTTQDTVPEDTTKTNIRAYNSIRKLISSATQPL